MGRLRSRACDLWYVAKRPRVKVHAKLLHQRQKHAWRKKQSSMFFQLPSGSCGGSSVMNGRRPGQ
eukprot:12912360-Prorocentrum_lima.AAC.1